VDVLFCYKVISQLAGIKMMIWHRPTCNQSKLRDMR